MTDLAVMPRGDAVAAEAGNMVRTDGRNRRAAETRRKIIEAAKAMIAETSVAPTVVGRGQAGRRVGAVGFPALPRCQLLFVTVMDSIRADLVVPEMPSASRPLSARIEAFRLYERSAGIPEDFIRMLNARNPDTNAWAKMERSDVSLAEPAVFESEAEAHGLDSSREARATFGRRWSKRWSDARPAFEVACITNNMKTGEGPGHGARPEKAAAVAEVMTLFEHVVGSKQGRLPQTRIPHLPACLRLDRRGGGVTVYLDDLG